MLLFAFFQFYCGQPGQKSPQFFKFFFFLLIMIRSGLWPKLGDPFVSQNPILQDGFWVVLMPFGWIVKFQFLAQFQVDHLTHPVVSSLIFSLLHSLIISSSSSSSSGGGGSSSSTTTTYILRSMKILLLFHISLLQYSIDTSKDNIWYYYYYYHHFLLF